MTATVCLYCWTIWQSTTETQQLFLFLFRFSFDDLSVAMKVRANNRENSDKLYSLALFTERGLRRAINLLWYTRLPGFPLNAYTKSVQFYLYPPIFSIFTEMFFLSQDE